MCASKRIVGQMTVWWNSQDRIAIYLSITAEAFSAIFAQYCWPCFLSNGEDVNTRTSCQSYELTGALFE